MKVQVSTQYEENYGSHTWNGEGVCPQGWKRKGGSTYIVENVPVSTESGFYSRIAQEIAGRVYHSDDYWMEYAIDWSVEEDDFVSQDEKLQLEYDGEIRYPDKRFDYKDL